MKGFWAACLSSFLCLVSTVAMAQIQWREKIVLPTLAVHAYADAYVGSDWPAPTEGVRPLLNAYNRDREFGVNLMYVELSAAHSLFRFKVTPAWGTYMMANYAHEPEGLRYLYEANAGAMIRDNMWLDMGVLPSPFGCETARSLGQHTLTRSLSAEYSPYYLSGARLATDLNKTTQLNLFAVNGWQNIRETNRGKAGIVQLLYTRDKEFQANYSGYLGDERHRDSAGGRAWRSFHDAWLKYKPNDRLEYVLLFDLGWQNGFGNSQFWHTGNITLRYHVGTYVTASFRVEYHKDPNRVLLNLPKGSPSVYGASLGFNSGLTDNAQIRLETRVLTTDQPTFNSETVYWMNTAAISVGF